MVLRGEIGAAANSYELLKPSGPFHEVFHGSLVFGQFVAEMPVTEISLFVD